jgi:hypothetical protein
VLLSQDFLRGHHPLAVALPAQNQADEVIWFGDELIEIRLADRQDNALPLCGHRLILGLHVPCLPRSQSFTHPEVLVALVREMDLMCSMISFSDFPSLHI